MKQQLTIQPEQKEQLQNPPTSSPLQSSPVVQTATHPLLRLQRAVGNQAVQRMVRAGGMGLQNRPNVHGFGSKTQTPPPPTTLVLQRKCACGGTAESLESTEECAECKAKREATVQRSATDQPAPSDETKTAPPIVHDVLRSPGNPLDGGTRSFMESRFGYDFSQVRIHTDKQAADSAQSVNALAYTVGRDVVFGAKQYAPGTSDGKRLMAHELTHVVQQGNGVAQTPHALSISELTAPAEQQAGQAAEAITRGETFPLMLHGIAQIARQEDAGTAGDGGFSDASSIPQPDAGATDAGATLASPADSSTSTKPVINSDDTAATTCLPTVTLDKFSNSGSTDPRDCQIIGSIGLGVGQSGTGSNGMEMRFSVHGHQPGTQYDILRTRAASLWEDGSSVTGGGWTLVDSQPMGTNDDHTNDDECLTPVEGKIFVVDTPGYRGSLPALGGSLGPLPDGTTVSDADAKDVVVKFTFAEWVIAKCADAPWTVVSTPTFVFWHSITWLTRDAALNWTLDRGHSEIATGSILSSINSPPSP